MTLSVSRQVTVTEEKDGKKVTKEKAVFDPHRLRMCLDTTNFSEYENGGMMNQVGYCRKHTVDTRYAIDRVIILFFKIDTAVRDAETAVVTNAVYPITLLKLCGLVCEACPRLRLGSRVPRFMTAVVLVWPIARRLSLGKKGAGWDIKTYHI